MRDGLLSADTSGRCLVLPRDVEGDDDKGGSGLKFPVSYRPLPEESLVDIVGRAFESDDMSYRRDPADDSAFEVDDAPDPDRLLP